MGIFCLIICSFYKSLDNDKKLLVPSTFLQPELIFSRFGFGSPKRNQERNLRYTKSASCSLFISDKERDEIPGFSLACALNQCQTKNGVFYKIVFNVQILPP